MKLILGDCIEKMKDIPDKKEKDMDLQTRLENIKRDNDRKKEEKNRIEGRLDSLKQQMKEQYQCETIEELKEKIAKLEPEIEAQEKDILERLEKMEAYAN